jgi:hypothetical protein
MSQGALVAGDAGKAKPRRSPPHATQLRDDPNTGAI